MRTQLDPKKDWTQWLDEDSDDFVLRKDAPKWAVSAYDEFMKQQDAYESARMLND